MATFVDTFIPDTTRSGYITKFVGLGTTYSAYPGVDALVGANYIPTPKPFHGGFFSYDTSSIPNGATITGVRWYLNFYGQQSSGGPTDWRHELYTGTWIGSTLDGADYNGGTLDQQIDWPGTPGGPLIGWITLTAGTHARINKIGYTDLSLIEWSLEAWPWGLWSIVCYILLAKRACVLEVTYEYEPTMSPANMVASNWGR